MKFNYELGLKEKNKTTKREALRAVIIKEDKILMVKTNKGDYKFPGGGAEKGESPSQTLIREVGEEVGYKVVEVKEKLGVIIERSRDKMDEDAIFEMTSTYYLCEVSKERIDTNLDDYEKELEFKGCFITFDEAIALNEEGLIHGGDINPWVYRETMALRALRVKK